MTDTSVCSPQGGRHGSRFLLFSFLSGRRGAPSQEGRHCDPVPTEGRGVVAGGGSSRCSATKPVGPASDCASNPLSARPLRKPAVSPGGLRSAH